MTLVPWQSGHSATWDVTIVHTLAAHECLTELDPGRYAAAAT